MSGSRVAYLQQCNSCSMFPVYICVWMNFWNTNCSPHLVNHSLVPINVLCLTILSSQRELLLFVHLFPQQFFHLLNFLSTFLDSIYASFFSNNPRRPSLLLKGINHYQTTVRSWVIKVNFCFENTFLFIFLQYQKMSKKLNLGCWLALSHVYPNY